MKTKRITFLVACIAFTIGLAQVADAQFRSDVPTGYERTGPVTKPMEENVSNMLGLQDFRMDHSYEMTMGTFGGDVYNQNFYTNTMHLLFNENLYGRVDLGIAHSPFGSNIMGNDDVQFFVRNAEINYKFSDNARVRVAFQQLPAGYGFGHYGYGGYGYSPFSSHYGYSPFHRSPNRSIW